MRKRLILGDMHGRYEVVRNIYDFEQPDDVIMLGDYVDTHELMSDEQQHEALNKLVRMQFTHIKEGKGEFIMLMGNHDYHYFYGNCMTEKYSGYSYNRAEWATDFFQQMVKCNQMQMIYCDEVNKTIYSHAGISNVWMNMYHLELDDVNLCIKIDYDIDKFRFTYGSGFSQTGDCPENSCIWIRPFSLLKNMYTDKNGITWTQIVGHTPCRKNIVCLTPGVDGAVNIDNAKLILIDNLPYQYIVEWLNDDGTLYSREIVDNLTKPSTFNLD